MSEERPRRSTSELENWLKSDEVAGISTAAHGALGLLLGAVPGFVYRCRNEAGWPMEFVSDRIQQVLGYLPSQVIAPGFDWESLIHPDDRADVQRVVAEAVEAGQCFRAVYRVRNATGDWRWCADAGAALHPTDDRSILEGVILDVTRERRLQRERIRRQRAEMLSGVAARVAHDFNNLLQAISGVAADLEIAAGERERELGDDLSRLVTKGAQLTSQMAETLQPSASRRRETEVVATIRAMVPILQRILGEKIRLDVTCEHAPAVVVLEPIRFEQVLLNLASNARDAIHGAGSCAIRSWIDFDRSEVAIAVQDDGHGIAPAVRERIFDEFVTTKHEAKGRGLGLSIVAEVLQECGGSVKVESEPEHGTTFVVRFPARIARTPQDPGA